MTNNHLNRTSTTLGFDIPKNYTFTLSVFLFWSFSTYSRRCRGLLLQVITLKDTNTFGRISLDKGSARRRDLNLTIH